MKKNYCRSWTVRVDHDDFFLYFYQVQPEARHSKRESEWEWKIQNKIFWMIYSQTQKTDRRWRLFFIFEECNLTLSFPLTLSHIFSSIFSSIWWRQGQYFFISLLIFLNCMIFSSFICFWPIMQIHRQNINLRSCCFGWKFSIKNLLRNLNFKCFKNLFVSTGE